MERPPLPEPPPLPVPTVKLTVMSIAVPGFGVTVTLPTQLTLLKLKPLAVMLMLAVLAPAIAVVFKPAVNQLPQLEVEYATARATLVLLVVETVMLSKVTPPDAAERRLVVFE